MSASTEQENTNTNPQQQESSPSTSAGELTEAQLRNLRGQIHQNLLRHDIYGQIRHILSQNAVDPSSGSFQAPTSPSDVLETLRQRGVVQQLAASLLGGAKSGGGSSGSTLKNSSNTLHPLQVNRVSSVDVKSALQTRGAQRLLLIRLLGGRAFIDNMIAADQLQSSSANPNNSTVAGSSMIVHIHFGPHRFRSQPKPIDVDPEFDDEFLAELNVATKMDISELNYPLRIMVTRESPFMSKSVYVGENTVDWRRVLKTGSLSVAVELNSNGSHLDGSGGAGGGVPAGLLELQLELMPDVRAYSGDELQLRAEQEKNATVAADREMLLYARRWWAEYHALSPKFSSRKVKVFAHSHVGGGRTLPVTHFIHRIAPDRSIEGPEDAARFVSLFQLEKPSSGSGSELVIGGGDGSSSSHSSSSSSSSSSWCDLMRFLTTRRGDRPAFASLLCSLFLGLGLDAYCAIGSSSVNQNEVAVAVITRSSNGMNTMWDPVQGTRRDISSSENKNNNSTMMMSMMNQSQQQPHQPGYCLSTIGCIFNATDYFANIQQDDSVFHCCFDLDDESKWKRMNPVKLHIVPRPQVAPPLWIPLDSRGIEQDFEQRFQRALVAYRERKFGAELMTNDSDNGDVVVRTKFDTHLASVFAQALSKSELRRRGASSSTPQSALDQQQSTELFQQCVRGFVEGHTFKGLPLCLSHLDANKALSAALQVPVGKTVIECPFDGAQHAVRAKVYLFPEGVVACWVMIGVKYRTI